ncbi:Nuclear receptor 2C2-associated protein [Halocaridina rubra]|uniref:Nuclear receptor 2C2-associated protein n=1 Tax=Halocaridina rubra TaxID=373956 RepID=A0AAN8ZSP6_HALRR
MELTPVLNTSKPVSHHVTAWAGVVFGEKKHLALINMGETSLVQECECRVSSVLGRNARELGKQHLFDGSPETCWNSDHGTPQWVALRWKEPVTVTAIAAQFQGGFCGSHDTIVEIGTNGSNSWQEATPWHLEDVGTEQTLRLDVPLTLTRLRLNFNSSTDFHGRIIMYKLDVIGRNHSE